MWFEISIQIYINSFIHNVEKWPNILLKTCGAQIKASLRLSFVRKFWGNALRNIVDSIDLFHTSVLFPKSLKTLKASGFLVFLEGIEKDQWNEMGQSD